MGDKRVGLITGAAQGIGKVIAETLSTEDTRIIINDIQEDKLKETVSEMELLGYSVDASIGDITDSKYCRSLVKSIVDKYGKIDFLVNNAGLVRDNLIHKITEDDWDQVIDTNLKGTFNMIQAVSSQMVRQKYGEIVNLSSTSAKGNRGQINYAAAKAGIIGITKTMSIELGKYNIHVNAVAPGFIETEMTKKTAERIGVSYVELKKEAAKKIPLQRVGQPIDVANTISWLVSKQSDFVSGQIIYVRGGP